MMVSKIGIIIKIKTGFKRLLIKRKQTRISINSNKKRISTYHKKYYVKNVIKKIFPAEKQGIHWKVFKTVNASFGSFVACLFCFECSY